MKESDDMLEREVSRLAAALVARGWMLATAESCTGGLIAAACTSVAGSSDWFERGIVSYSNAAKTELLGVPAELIARHGAVSGEVAAAMADGALRAAPAQLALAQRGQPAATRLLRLHGDRATIRAHTVTAALRALLDTLEAA